VRLTIWDVGFRQEKCHIQLRKHYYQFSDGQVYVVQFTDGQVYGVQFTDGQVYVVGSACIGRY